MPESTYRLTAFAVLAWIVALGLAAYDEHWAVPHAAAINAALFLIGVLIVFALALALRRAREWRRTRAPLPAELRDRLTGLPNHRHLDIQLDQETARAHRYRRPLTLVIVDVNSMQSVNQQYGRASGDRVLLHVTDVLKSHRRGSDVVTRLSADRFAIVLPECDSASGRAFVARIEQHLAREPASVEVDGRQIAVWIGLCAGLSTLDGDASTPADLIARAEADLLTAKFERDKRRRLWLSAA